MTRNYEVQITLYIDADSAEDAEAIADELVHVNVKVTDRDIQVLNPDDREENDAPVP